MFFVDIAGAHSDSQPNLSGLAQFSTSVCAGYLSLSISSALYCLYFGRDELDVGTDLLFPLPINGSLVISLQAKGNDAANTGGAQSVLNAAAAANANEVLDSILPPTVASYVELVKVHLNAGRLSSITHIFIFTVKSLCLSAVI